MIVFLKRGLCRMGLGLGLSLLVACASAPAATPTVAPEATVAMAAHTHTATATATSSATNTATSTATATNTPSPSPTASTTPTPVPPSSTPTPTATTSPTATPTATTPPTATATPAPSPTPTLAAINLGVDFSFLTAFEEVRQNDVPLVSELGATWVRTWVQWSLVEAEPGVYDWTYPEAMIGAVADQGLQQLVVVYGAPEWAAVDPAATCGPIADLDAFAQFLRQLTDRYGDVVDAWEFTNEPDGRDIHEWSPIIGCWGNHPAAYAEQLAFFYQQIKTLDPGALVVSGGIAYDNWAVFERSFFEQVLASGGGSYFDRVGLHYYPINPVEFPTLAAKMAEVQGIMQRYGVDKPFWITETSMWVNGPDGPAAQANFIVQELSRAYCQGADNIFWFEVRQMPGEPALQRWLISSEHQFVNSTPTFQHFARQMQNKRCVGPLPALPEGVTGFEFAGPSQSLYILWSNAPQTLTLPAATSITRLNRDGTESQQIDAVNGSVTIQLGPEPVFLIIPE